jgi:hypothetical protein
MIFLVGKEARSRLQEKKGLPSLKIKGKLGAFFVIFKRIAILNASVTGKNYSSILK